MSTCAQLELFGAASEPRRIALVGCGASKASTRSWVRDLYTGTLVQRSIAYGERTCAATYILSALHGLVPLNTLLDPYNVTLKGQSQAARAAWAAKVAAELRQREPPPAHVVLLAGRDYRGPLVPLLEAAGYTLEAPLESRRIGEAVAWLNQELGGAAQRKAVAGRPSCGRCGASGVMTYWEWEGPPIGDNGEGGHSIYLCEPCGGSHEP
jgi:hypothetical protein